MDAQYGAAQLAAALLQPTHVSDLPHDVLLPILRQLAPLDLVHIAVQDKRFQQMATDDELWTQHALKRWPDSSCKHYGNSWHTLYSQRALQPAGFANYIDRVALLTERAHTGNVRLNNSPTSSPVKRAPSAGSVHGFPQLPAVRVAAMVLEEVMQAVFNTGLLLEGRHQLRTSPDFRLLQRALLWWLETRPELVVGFARSASLMLRQHDMWGSPSGCSHWGEVPWRRSALQFLLQMVAGCDVHLSIIDRLAREAEQLDGALRALQQEQHALGAGVRAPRGMPRSHWWFQHAVQAQLVH